MLKSNTHLENASVDLIVLAEENEYMAFGLSGSPNGPLMLGSDITIAYVDGHRGYANDYNVTARSPVRIFFNLSFR